MVVPDDQWISMAHVEFEFSSMIEASLDVVKTVYWMIGVLQQSRQAGAATQSDFFLAVLFGHKVLTFRAKTLGLTITGYTWQWRMSIRPLVEGIA